MPTGQYATMSKELFAKEFVAAVCTVCNDPEVVAAVAHLEPVVVLTHRPDLGLPARFVFECVRSGDVPSLWHTSARDPRRALIWALLTSPQLSEEEMVAVRSFALERGLRLTWEEWYAHVAAVRPMTVEQWRECNRLLPDNEGMEKRRLPGSSTMIESIVGSVHVPESVVFELAKYMPFVNRVRLVLDWLSFEHHPKLPNPSPLDAATIDAVVEVLLSNRVLKCSSSTSMLLSVLAELYPALADAVFDAATPETFGVMYSEYVSVFVRTGLRRFDAARAAVLRDQADELLTEERLGSCPPWVREQPGPTPDPWCPPELVAVFPQPWFPDPWSALGRPFEVSEELAARELAVWLTATSPPWSAVAAVVARFPKLVALVEASPHVVSAQTPGSLLCAALDGSPVGLPSSAEFPLWPPTPAPAAPVLQPSDELREVAAELVGVCGAQPLAWSTAVELLCDTDFSDPGAAVAVVDVALGAVALEPSG